jgi:phytoene/squalene synthetase
VRFADEIVDSFEGFDKQKLLTRFKEDTFDAIAEKISLNPILNNFQYVVNTYKIDLELITLFLRSMEMDLEKVEYDQQKYEAYILGSAEVVGLMCLRVFCEGDLQKYEDLKPSAMKLGSAFQKINFLRDLKMDFQGLGRSYFPGIDLNQWDEMTKSAIERDIEKDFADGLAGIRRLPSGARFGVYMAYVYFHELLIKIQSVKADKLLNERIRVSNWRKYLLLITAYVRNLMNRL